MNWDQINILMPILTFMAGWVLARFTLSKVDRLTLEQEYYKNTQDLRQKHETLYTEYTAAIQLYTTSTDTVGYQLFCDIAVKGDRYFGNMCIIADAIMSGKINIHIRDNTFCPAIAKAATVSLPQHYKILKKIAEKHDFQYSGKLERSVYKSLYAVAEKYPLQDA
jgi:hypothetical protein